MPINDDEEDRIARLDRLIEELRVKSQDVRELAARTRERAKHRAAQARATLNVAKARYQKQAAKRKRR